MKKNWIILISAAGVLLVGLLAAFLYTKLTSVGPNQQQEETIVVTEKPANLMIVGVDDSYIPITFRDSKSQLTGFDIDLAKVALEKMGREVEFKAINWSEKDDELNSGKIDIIWSGLTVTDERKGIYQLSDPYLEDTSVIAVLKSSPMLSMEDVGGKIIGVQSGSYAGEIVEDYDGPKGKVAGIKEYPSGGIALSKMLAGEVDAVVINEIQVLYFISNTPGKFRLIRDASLFDISETAVAAKKGNAALIREVNQTLKNMKTDGSYQEVFNNWFGTN